MNEQYNEVMKEWEQTNGPIKSPQIVPYEYQELNKPMNEVTIKNGFIIRRCKGDGQGSCTRCNSLGKWNRTWMTLLNKIDGMEGCYCTECTEAIINGKNE